MKKFTPGPWKRHANTNSGDTVICSEDNDMRLLLMVNNCDSGEHLANACLIESAPDLFEALEEMLSLFDSKDIVVTLPNRNASVECILKARAALAKAKGE